jgi:RimJ/RimL family protein N-acetyltransferase
MTLSEQVFTPARRDDVVPVLATARLELRAPHRSDCNAIATLVNDRRIAANTARIPYPYAIEDAEQFVASVNKREGEACFVITLDGTPIGMCSVDLREDGLELGYWLGVAYWGHGFATEAARALIDHAFGDLEHDTLISGLAPGAGEMRLPMDRRAAIAHPRHQLGGADRPLSFGSRLVGVVEVVGAGKPRDVTSRLYCPVLAGAAKNGASFAASAGPKWPCGFDGGTRSISSQPWIRARA